MLYEVSNNLSTSLVVEDIGVSLQARGGLDSSRVITQNMRDSSSDLRKMIQMRWVTVSSRPPAMSPVPVWPLSGIRTSPVDVPAQPAPAAAPPPAAVVPPVQDVSSLVSSVSHLDGMMSEILSILKRGGAPHGLPLPAQSPHFQQPSQDPFFIPSKVVPDAEAKITVASSETDSKEFDESKKALSKMRKK
jgi:hypothetical protein